MQPIVASRICKTYGETVALDHVDLTAGRGEITGLIGPDGAGKSSLMKIILGLVSADSGSLYLSLDNENGQASDLLGKDTGRLQREIIRRHVGYMPEVFSLYTDLSVEENLRFSHRIHRGAAADFAGLRDRLYKFNRLKSFSGTRAGALSGGMKQKLALSCALMHAPGLLVLDEPTTGVDPLSRREFWAMLSELKNGGMTIIVSTPYMEEALMCDMVTLMHNGRVLGNGTPDDLLGTFPGVLLEADCGAESPQKMKMEIREVLPERSTYLSGRNVRVFFPAGDRAGIDEADRIFEEKGWGPVRKVEPELEDLFVVKVLSEEDA